MFKIPYTQSRVVDEFLYHDITRVLNFYTRHENVHRDITYILDIYKNVCAW